jgi:hypothetical protein
MTIAHHFTAKANWRTSNIRVTTHGKVKGAQTKNKCVKIVKEFAAADRKSGSMLERGFQGKNLLQLCRHQHTLPQLCRHQYTRLHLTITQLRISEASHFCVRRPTTTVVYKVQHILCGITAVNISVHHSVYTYCTVCLLLPTVPCILVLLHFASLSTVVFILSVYLFTCLLSNLR